MRRAVDRGRHWVVRRPLELWALRLWPAVIVVLWVVTLATGGVVQPGDRVAALTSAAALVATALHLLRPLDTGARYTALIVNEIAMLDRVAAFVFIDKIRQTPDVAVLGSALWGTIATAKLVVFLLTAAVVERERIRREALAGAG